MLDAMSVPKLRKAVRARPPGLELERELWGAGAEIVVGMDEVGRGAWAGPLSVGAAVIPKDRRVYKVRDSKLLLPAERAALFPRLVDWCETWAVGHATAEECDLLGMSAAQRLAARRALDRLALTPDVVVLDGRWDFVGSGRVIPVVRGDATSVTIATASILAKVVRDEIMDDLAPEYPAYGFESNKGYPGPRHRAALAMLGPSAVHRRSWSYMEELPWGGLERRRAQGTLFGPGGGPPPVAGGSTNAR